MKRLLMLTALALFTGLGSTPVARAQEPLPVTSTTPANGARYSPGTVPVEWFLTSSDTGLTEVWVEIASRNVPGQDGTLANEFFVDGFPMFRGDAYPNTYKGIASRRWMESPGTYYWQIRARGSAKQDYRSPVYSLTIEAPREPEATPEPKLTAAELPRLLRIAIRSETGRSPQGLRRRCSRQDDQTFGCSVRWFDSRNVYAGDLTVQAADEETFMSEFDGLRASRRCVKRKSVRRCAKPFGF